jgi:hypothetical protein
MPIPCPRLFCFMALLILILSSGCQAAPATPTAPPAATELAIQPTLISTTLPQATPTPASTAAPTATIVPTSVPSATAAPTARPTATPAPLGPGGLPFPLKTSVLQVGVAAHLFYTSRALPLKRANEAGFGWIRQQIHWSDQEGPPGRYAWGELDAVVDAVHTAKLNLLLSVVSAPRFYTASGGHGMPKDPVKLGNFVAALTKHYKGRIQAIEIWNEQNLAVENGGRVAESDAGHYVELLKEAYLRIKAVDPSVYVIAGPPSSTGITKASVAIDDMTYYKAMYRYKDGLIRDYFDAQAVHPGGSANPPDTIWPDNPSKAKGWTTHRTFYFRHVEDVRALMERYGMDKHQVWITEFGWATPNSSPGFEFGNQVSFEQQADYIVGALRRSKEQYPWVGAMFLWNLNFAILRARSGQPRHEQASFGILNANGSPRPSFLAIQRYLAELRAGQ